MWVYHLCCTKVCQTAWGPALAEHEGEPPYFTGGSRNGKVLARFFASRDVRIAFSWNADACLGKLRKKAKHRYLCFRKSGS